ncbi:MAG TPA: iron-containing alcohol dehydrogenase [Verrucomicrobiae bacterium]|nr:iron-containing alcohol dehydrogenase [Verrucomicrobiae bacterium]
MRFEFSTAANIRFGPGTIRELAALARDFGKRALLVTGANPSRVDPIADLLKTGGVESVLFSVAGEPGIITVQDGVAVARENQCSLVICVGGGSAIDAGKAIAIMLTNAGDLLDYLEVIGRGQPLRNAGLPCIAVPTTAGTGTEVTRNAVLASPEHCVKVSLRSPLMLPRVALVDPDLTHDLPPRLTASTGLDALTQSIEPYVSARANPMTDALCLEGIPRIARSLRKAVENGRDAAAREDLALASLFGGLALANAGLGAVHGFAAPIGGRFPAPHGAVCAALLPHVMSANLRALRERAAQHQSLERFETVARLLTGDCTASADAGVKWVARLVSDLHVPPLRSYGIDDSHVDTVCENASKASSMKANPIQLTAAELAQTLRAAI